MIQFSWQINLGEVITLLTIVANFCYFFGKLNQKVEGLEASLSNLRNDYSNHCDQDVERFDALHRDLTTVAAAKKGT